MKAYRGIAYGVAGFVVLQAAFLALGFFALEHDVDNGKIVDKNYDGNAGLMLHGIGAIVVAVLALALIITSLVVKTAGASKRAGAVLGLVVLQWVLAFVAFGLPAIGALHAINAFAVLAAAVWAARLVPAGTTTGAAMPAQRGAPDVVQLDAPATATGTTAV